MANAFYTSELYNPARLKFKVARMARLLSPHLDRFDSLVVRGTSGTIFGGALSVELGKPLFVVRKPQENSHTNGLVSGEGNPGRWLFLDDFVSSGDTRRACKDALVGEVGRFMGSALYCEELVKWEWWEDEG